MTSRRCLMTPRINLNNDLSQVLEALNSQAGGQADAGPRAAEMARRIEEKLILARKWSEQLKAQLASRPTLRDAVSLLTGATSRHISATSRSHLGTSRQISAHLGRSRHISPGRDRPSDPRLISALFRRRGRDDGRVHGGVRYAALSGDTWQGVAGARAHDASAHDARRRCSADAI